MNSCLGRRDHVRVIYFEKVVGGEGQFRLQMLHYCVIARRWRRLTAVGQAFDPVQYVVDYAILVEKAANAESSKATVCGYQCKCLPFHASCSLSFCPCKVVLCVVLAQV